MKNENKMLQGVAIGNQVYAFCYTFSNLKNASKFKRMFQLVPEILKIKGEYLVFKHARDLEGFKILNRQ